MKKSLLWITILILSLSMLAVFSLSGCKTTAAAETTAAAASEEKVTIVVTSWRTDDIDAMNKINAVFMEKYPNITVKFDPIKNTEYAAQLQTALETQSDKYDVMGIFPFGMAQTYSDNGYALALDDLVPNLSNIPENILVKYSAGGSVIAVPVAAVSHGVYYNKDIFAKYDLQVPKTWAEFMAVCKTLKDNGETVIAQGAADGFAAGEHFYDNIGPNFFGGEASRQKLMAGEMKFTDEKFVNAFTAVESLIPYFVDGYQAVDYVGMQQLFKTGQAAIMFSGSWEISGFQASEGLNFGWFAPPLENAGDKLQYCFLSDLGFAMSKYTKNPDAAAKYLNWVSSPEFAQLFMENIPGFFTYVTGDYTLDPVALQMLNAAKDADLIERLMTEKLSDKAPSGTEILNTAAQKLILGEVNPKEAAEYVQTNLETWFTFK